MHFDCRSGSDFVSPEVLVEELLKDVRIGDLQAEKSDLLAQN